MSCATGCTPPSEEERQNLMKWSERIENLLKHDQGLDRYRRYLSEIGLTEDLNTLTFWEKANELETIAYEMSAISKRGEKRKLFLKYSRDNFDSKSRELVNFAKEEINFDLQQLRELAAIENNPEESIKVLPRAKLTVQYLLEESYQEFIKNQLDSRFSITY